MADVQVRGHLSHIGSLPRTPRTLGHRPINYDGEASGSEPTVYNADRGFADDMFGQAACWTTLPQLSGRSVSPKPARASNDISKLDNIIQQAKEVQDQLLSSVRVTVPDSSIAEPVTADATVPSSHESWAFSAPMRRSREGKGPFSKPEESSRVRRAADELLESVRRRALEAEIERLRGELASAEASKQKLQAGEAAEAEAGAEAARLLREARVEVNRLKAALQRQGHFERTKEVESHRQAFEQELRSAREDAARKREELQHLNQVQQEQVLKERDTERRLRLESETRCEVLGLQVHELQEAERLRHHADTLLGELREEIRKLQGLLQMEQSARQAAEQRQSTAEGLHQRTKEENGQLKESVKALSVAQQEKQKLEELLSTERSLRRTAEEQCKNLEADIGRCRKELDASIQERKTELQSRQEAELRSRTAEDSCITLRNEMLGLEAQLRDLRSQLEEKGSASEQLRRKVESLQTAEETWTQERTSLQAQLAMQSSGIKSHSMEIESLQQKVENGNEERQSLQRQLDQAKQELASLHRQLEEAKGALSEFDALQQRLSKERDDALRQVQEAQVNLQKQQSEAETLSSKLSQAQSVSKGDLEEMQRQMESLRKERDMFQEDVEHLRQSIRERRSAESSLRAALQEEQNSSRILHQELDEAKKLRSFSMGSQDGTSAEPSPPRPRGAPVRTSTANVDVQSLVEKIRRSQQTTAPVGKDVVDVTSLEQPRDVKEAASPSSSYETTSEDVVDLTGDMNARVIAGARPR